MGEINNTGKVIIGAVIAIFLVVVLVAQLFPTSLGQIANATKGSAMTNVDAGTKSLFTLIALFSVIAVLILILKATHVI